MEYACVVWNGCTGTESNKLEAIQLRAGRIVCGAIRLTSHEIIYNELGWEKLSKRRERFKLILYHKMIYKLAPEYLCDLLPPSTSIRNPYPVRGSSGLSMTVPKARLSLFDHSFLPSTTRLLNQLPEQTRLLSDLVTFKRALCPPTDCLSAKLYMYGRRDVTIIHSRIRMRCSALKAHLFDMHIIDDSHCQCGARNEDAIHFFFDCPMYTLIRNQLHGIVIQYAPFNMKTLLYGDNTSFDASIEIFKAVHSYIRHSKRFNLQP